MKRRIFLLGAAATAAIATGLTWRTFSREIAALRAGLATGSDVIQTRSGAMEYATAGDGPPVLILHGTGGGFDQGLAFGRNLVAAGFRVIAPSRFGYLRSDMPDDNSSEAQADALTDLLDHLGIDRIPVLGGSAGALPALAFAIRHPDRCSALVPMVPATFVPGRPPVRPNRIGAAIMEYGLKSDFLFWAGMRLAEDRMFETLLATDPALIHAAAPDEQARVRALLHNILPVTDRARGLLMDGRLAGTPAQMALDTITAPTLAISMQDDHFGTYAAARHIADTVPGARLFGFPTGGHVWVGHDAEIFDEIARFLRGL